MSASHPIRGVLPVFQTPFLEDESIDFGTLQREVEWLYDRGADGIVMAMVSETLRLSSEEREQLAAAACRFGCDRGAVVISVGAESSRLAERYSRQAEAAGAHAVMAIPPVSVGLADDELLRYYERIIRCLNIPVIVQDASGYVGRPMSIDLQARLLKEFGDRVRYKPEANPIGPRLTALRQATGGQAQVFEGTGGIALVESHARGIVGTMPGAEMIDGLVALWRALEAGDSRRVERLAPLVAIIVSLQTSLDAFLAVEKYLLRKQGIFSNEHVRGPRGYALDDITRQQVDRWFSLLQAVLAE
ncbi:MAG: dihydrodipicolinate synthase family protein [Pirellulales bacterium]